MPPAALNSAPDVIAPAMPDAAGAPPRIEMTAGNSNYKSSQTVAASGCWTALSFSSPPDWKALARSLALAPMQSDTGWDLRGIAQLDHIGAQLLWSHWRESWPAQLQMTDQQRAVLDQVARYTVPVPRAPRLTLRDHFHRFANRGPQMLGVARDFIQLIGQLALDIGRLIRAPHRAPWRDFSGHLYNIGATAMPITALVGLLIGVVLAYLTSQQLRQYGGETFIVNILGLSLIRELGPILAAVLVAGRSGSAITAQIGVMRVTDELDAMRVMGISHGFRLVMPRVLALAIVMPLISVWTSMAALLGGMMAADLSLDISPAYFLSALPRAVPMVNLWLGMSKSAVFGIAIALIACFHGLRVQPNTESLGRGTTSSVVTSITVVILIDALFAILFRGSGFRA
jgi:phospholipid/cholesterol/gamma-HCH transport system permease protein